MPAEVAAPLLQVDFTDAAFYDELAQHCGLHLQQGGERIHAEVASAAQRRVLQLGPRTAVFRIERLATWLARPAEWRVTLVRGDRFSLSAEWSAESDYQLQPAPATARPAG
jgi:GntR family transcriptional regulator